MTDTPNMSLMEIVERTRCMAESLGIPGQVHATESSAWQIMEGFHGRRFGVFVGATCFGTGDTMDECLTIARKKMEAVPDSVKPWLSDRVSLSDAVRFIG